MKMLFVLLTTVLAFSAHANDRKVGNVIAVERELSDLYSTCLKATSGDTSKSQMFYSCAINFLSEGELPVSSGRVIKLIDSQCSVVGEVLKGTLLITYSTGQRPSNFEASKACLEKALLPKDHIKLIVYTLE